MGRAELLLTIILALCACCFAGIAGETPLGSENFKPSSEHPVGWRGDGNGRYVAADPPRTWGRVSSALKGLTTQTAKPKPDDAGAPLATGVIHEWLTLGPAPIPAGKQPKDEYSDESKWSPSAGDKVGDLEWKAVKLDTSWLNFWPLYKEQVKDAKTVMAYAFTWLHSDEGKPVFMNMMLTGPGKVWLNGKDLGTFNADGNHLLLPLQKGWNALLLRVAPRVDTAWSKGVIEWHFNAAFFGGEHETYDSTNIRWSTPMPDHGPGVGSPILIGDKLFMEAEGGLLVCVSATDGKVLWAKATTFADAATAEERAANTETFAEVDKLNTELTGAIKAYCDNPTQFTGDEKSRARLANAGKINTLLKKMDEKKYPRQSSGEAGESAPTPVSDGQLIYVLYGQGLAACFDLNGNRKWVRLLGLKNNEHGYHASPALADGKLIIKAQDSLGVVALDCQTGEQAVTLPAWKTKGLAMYSFPLPVSVGGETLIVQSFGVVSRLKDGKVLEQTFTPPYYNIFDYVSPTIENKTLCSLIMAKTSGGFRFAFQTLPDAPADPLVMKDVKECEYDLKAFPCWFSYDHCASPLLYQGLLYSMSVDGVLTVVDAAKGEVVYQKMLDLSPIMYHNGPVVRAGCAGSLTLAGKYIYCSDDQGSTVVIEPGRTFKQVAKNRIEQLWYRYGPERNECFISNPVFSGKQMFYRGELNLYCIAER